LPREKERASRALRGSEGQIQREMPRLHTYKSTAVAILHCWHGGFAGLKGGGRDDDAELDWSLEGAASKKPNGRSAGCYGTPLPSPAGARGTDDSVKRGFGVSNEKVTSGQLARWTSRKENFGSKRAG